MSSSEYAHVRSDVDVLRIAIFTKPANNDSQGSTKSECMAQQSTE